MIEQQARVPMSIFQPRLDISERRLLLASTDTLIVLVSLFGSLLFWERLAGRNFTLAVVQSQAGWMVTLTIAWLLWLALSDTYNLRLAVRAGAIAWRIVAGALFVTFVYLVVFFVTSRAVVTEGLPNMFSNLTNGTEPVRFAPAMAIASATGLLLLWRNLYVWLLCGPQTRPRLLILGAGQAGRSLYATIAWHYPTHYNIIGFVDDAPQKQSERICGIPVLGTHQQLEHLAWQTHADEIALAISTRLPESMLQALMACHEQGITITPMPLVYERMTGKVAVQHIGSQWYVALPLQPRSGATALAAAKRALDLLGGLLLGIVFLVLLPLIALLIRLDSAGSIFYRQIRLGLHGKPFMVWKFRSMITNAEQHGQARWATADDDRITRVGGFLRRTRLDELPQILNVIRGEMSLVGPRPERPEFIEQLQQQIPYYRTRLAAKPGLTGWAQINYRYGASVSDALVKLQYDLYYLKHQSAWFDLLILARTIAVVLKMQGQ
jgi:exopolysaccharide biosynthesis polyprenyl glycosylphosphotransferase